MDYHIHSNNSYDGQSSIFEMCQKAIGLGIGEIGFSEHVDFEPRDWGFGFFNYDRYTSEIRNAKVIFQNRLVIRKGVEIDYQHCFEDAIKEWLKNKRFDFIVGSVHYLDHEIISHGMVMANDIGKIYDTYLSEVKWSIESGLSNVLGHFDVLRRYVDTVRLELNKFNYWENVKAILEEIVERKTYLEVNSKGLREACEDTIPSREIVDKYIEKGGKLISVGSDAHSTLEIGSGSNEIMNFLAQYDGDKVKLLFE